MHDSEHLRQNRLGHWLQCRTWLHLLPTELANPLWSQGNVTITSGYIYTWNETWECGTQTSGHFMPWPVLCLTVRLDYTNEKHLKKCIPYIFKSKLQIDSPGKSPLSVSKTLSQLSSTARNLQKFGSGWCGSVNWVLAYKPKGSHAWVVDQVPSSEREKQPHIDFSLPLFLFTFPSL